MRTKAHHEFGKEANRQKFKFPPPAKGIRVLFSNNLLPAMLNDVGSKIDYDTLPWTIPHWVAEVTPIGKE